MPTTISIDDRIIGGSAPCFIIAEACDNHLGSIDVAKEMVRQAKACGCDAIKFQHHLPEDEMLQEGVPMSSNFNMPLFEFLKRYALTADEHCQLQEYCRTLGITYLCTPFCRRAAEDLQKMGVSAFKIGSGELTDLPTVKIIASYGKPLILSTGMSEWNEIDETFHTVKRINPQLALMNCVSEYPARHRDVNLGVIREMSERYDAPIGHSDHTPDIYTSIAAVALGARLLEKHIILDKRQPGPDQSVSIEPYELYELVRAVRRVEESTGTAKSVHDLERPIREWARRSVVSLRPIARGTKITEEMIWTKRPGTGIPAKELDNVVSRFAAVDIPADHLIRWEELA